VIPKRLAWMAVGGAVTLIVKARAERAVTAEAHRLGERLPMPAARLVERLPPDVARAAGVVVVAGRAATVSSRAGYRVAVVGGRGAVMAGSAAAVAGRAVSDGVGVARSAASRVRHDLDTTRTAWSSAAAEEERLLRADLALLAGDRAGAVEALVDRRAEPPPDPPPAPPQPVASGRPRAAAEASPPPGRVQRRYHPPLRSW
jgi:hypothetical protein